MFNEATFREILLPSSPDDGRSISRNVASLSIHVHDVINLLYYKEEYKEEFDCQNMHYFLFWETDSMLILNGAGTSCICMRNCHYLWHYLLKQSLKTQEKLKELESMYQNAIYICIY